MITGMQLVSVSGDVYGICTNAGKVPYSSEIFDMGAVMNVNHMHLWDI